MPACQRSGWRGPCTAGCHLAALPNPSRVNTLGPAHSRSPLGTRAQPAGPWEKTHSRYAETVRGARGDPGGIATATVSTRTGSATGTGCGQSPGRASTLAPPTPQLGTGSGADRSWEDCHRGSPDLWWQNSHLNSCSHTPQPPAPA